jgi:oxygen-independent coproporphyrinogen-3 oxidase
MQKNELIARYEAPVPRYTSYPTAPHFGDGITAANYRDWLTALPDQSRLSLYLHIPFCDTLCWFCGCHTKMVRRYAPVETYLHALLREIALVGEAVGSRGRVTQIHWGGGSPTILSAADITRLAEHLRMAFAIDTATEFAVEIDPRDFTEERLLALVRAGLTRASIGVQDFDETVQRAINRRQSFEETAMAVRRLRALGVASINIDLLYGLPHQTRESLAATLEQVLLLQPDRMALFGYAHVPWMKRHQAMIDTQELPDALARFETMEMAATRLIEAGYVRIGLDHFARPGDSLGMAAASRQLRRNFQGYTVDDAEAILGLGASAIGELPQGYVQNIVTTADYQRRIEAGRLATAKGIALGGEDRLRRDVIERLMCDLSFSKRRIREKFGEAAEPVVAIAEGLANGDRDGLVEPTQDGFAVTERGRPFLRVIAAAFDNYLQRGAGRHSSAL